MAGKRPAVESPPRPVKRNRGLDPPIDALVDDMPSVATDGPHRPDNQPRDDELGLMSRYLGKMVKEQWPMFKTIESKAPDWPGDTEKEGLGSHCVWKPEDEVVCRDDEPLGGQANHDFDHLPTRELDSDNDNIEEGSIEQEHRSQLLF